MSQNPMAMDWCDDDDDDDDDDDHGDGDGDGDDDDDDNDDDNVPAHATEEQCTVKEEDAW